jgi:GT2 family glycosyltransferase
MSTSKKLAIYLPTYKRPSTLQRVADNIAATTKTPYTLYFGIEPEDTASIAAAKATGHKVVVNKYDGGYANTVQSMYEESKEPFFFHANDDFVFLEGWELEPIKMLEDNPKLMVVGCNDGTSTTNFWTISMVRRKYIKEMSGVVDMPNRVFYPYGHNFIDTEFSQTAIKRGVWEACKSDCIEHKREGHDETYEKNNATYQGDQVTYYKRLELFW